MKLDAALPPTRLSDVPAIARAAEAAGFAAIWTQETQHDPFLPHALIAEHTTRISSGTGIAVSFGRSPATLAYSAWDLAAQSGGRFILGLGTQVKAHIERRFGMEWPASVTGKLREQVQVIRAFWDTWQNGTPLNFRGEYYKITLMSPFFNPGPIENPHIPIYVAGVNPGLAKLAGEMCEGFHVHPFHTVSYLREVLLPSILSGAAKTGRERTDISLATSIFAATTEGEREFCRQQVSFYASTPSYRPVLEHHGWLDVGEKLSLLAARGQWGEMSALITDDMLAEFCTQASGPVGLAAALKDRYKGLADRLTLYIPFVPGEKDAFWAELGHEFGEEG
ncbi:MAG TPA: TIGR03617 family F420-dependent LLM class oxidoreductase [Anaerolineales bacterium]|jgi:probable F420-dependent oxidoreductase